MKGREKGLQVSPRSLSLRILLKGGQILLVDVQCTSPDRYPFVKNAVHT